MSSVKCLCVQHALPKSCWGNVRVVVVEDVAVVSRGSCESPVSSADETEEERDCQTLRAKKRRKGSAGRGNQRENEEEQASTHHDTHVRGTQHSIEPLSICVLEPNRCSE